MSQITVRQDPVITEPELAALGRRIAGELILAAQKAAAHAADPTAFPVGADADAEHLFLERLRALPAARRDRAGVKAAGFLRGPAAVRAPLVGDLADLDVTQVAAVADAAKARPLPAVRLTTDKIRAAFRAGDPAVKAARRTVLPSDAGEWLELRLLDAVCVDETDGFLGSEAGSDEIDVAVIFMDAIQRVTKTPVHDLGSYGQDGAGMSPPGPRVLGGVDLRAGFYWPRTITATVCLSERDEGGFPDWMHKVFEFAKGKATAAIASAIGAAIGGLIGAGIGAAIGALVGWIIGEVIGAIKTWWEDDVFEPANLTLEIPSADAATSGQFQIRYWGHGGEYLLTVELQRTAVPGSQPAPTLVTGELEDRLTDLCGIAACLTSEIPPPKKMRDPLTGQVITMPALQRPVETPLVFAIGRADGAMMVRAYAGTTTPWVSLGGAFHSGPAVAMTSPTRPVVFAVGTDDALYHKWRDNRSAPWSDWHSLGGKLTSGPAACMSGNRLVVVARGTDGAYHHRYYDNGWSDWQSLGGGFTSPPSIVHAGKLMVFGRGLDGALWHKWYEGGWSDWHSLGGALTSGPSAMKDSDGRPVVYVRGTDGAIHHKWYDGGWSDWHGLGGVSLSAPAALVGRAKQSAVLCRGTDGAIYERHYAGGWTPWASLGMP